jgi:hypothetical protein
MNRETTLKKKKRENFGQKQEDSTPTTRRKTLDKSIE